MKLTLADIGPKEQLFTHVDTETGVATVIAAERAGRLFSAEGHAPVKINVDKEFGDWLDHHRGVEQPRIDRLTSNVVAMNPVVMLAMPDGTHLLADGTHRYKWAAQHGWTVMLAYLIPEDYWRDFIVHDVPPEMIAHTLSAPSGIA